MQEELLYFWQNFGVSSATSIIISILMAGVWSVIFYFWQKSIDNKYQKQLENLKAKNDKLNYITKTQFDAEFKMYQELSEANFQAILKSYLLFPTGLDSISSNKEECQKEYKKRYDEAVETLVILQNLLFKYAAFIEEDLYKKFDEIRLLIKLNIDYFPEIRLRDDINLPIKIETECFNRTNEIKDKYDMLINTLRTYLKLLKVQED